MIAYAPQCPHCGSIDLERSDKLEEGGGEQFVCTHHCRNPDCDLHFKYTPRIPGFTGTEAVV